MANKYIDADKLIAGIKRKIESIENCPFQLAFFGEEKKSEVELIAYKDALSLIDSLQQEQLEEICSKCIHHGKDDDYCHYPYGGMRGRINENGVYECTGFYEKEQEQPEVDFETEYAKFSNDPDALDYAFPIDLADYKDFARHFYELGLNSKTDAPKIKGWVARDKDGSIWFHYQKPHKENDIEKSWWGSDDRTFELFDVDCPDLKWDDEPIEVELEIHRV